MKLIIFSPTACNLAETTRTLEIAKACRDVFEIVFVSYGGEFENLIEKEGFVIPHLMNRGRGREEIYMDGH